MNYKEVETRKKLREIRRRSYAPPEKIFICAEFGKNSESGLEVSKFICAELTELRAIPICPQLFSSTFLGDADKEQEQKEMIALGMLEDADMMWVCSGLSENMKVQISKAWDMGIPVKVKPRAGETAEEIKEELETWYGKKHHTEVYDS